MTAIFASLIAAVVLTPDPVPEDIRRKVDALLADAQIGRSGEWKELDSLGVPGIRALLDRLFPESAGCDAHPVIVALATGLVRDLGDLQFAVREQATRDLLAIGPSARGVVSSAIENTDPEIRERGKRILAGWDRPIDARQGEAHVRSSASHYFFRVRDRARAEVCASRAATVLNHRAVPAHPLDALLTLAMHPIVQSGCDDLCDRFQSTVTGDNEKVAVFVVEAIGSGHTSDFFPRLLLTALEDPREPVVSAALGWTPNCWDQAKIPELRRRLTRLFQTGSDRIKFEACFPLMHGFSDSEAISYLLKKAAHGNVTAIHWIGDSCNWNMLATAEIYEALVPHLSSHDAATRRATADALATYRGEAVNRYLIDMLADDQTIIVSETMKNLVGKSDKRVVRRQVEKAAAAHRNHTIRARAKELLAMLAQEENRPRR